MSDLTSPNPVSRERQLVSQWLRWRRQHRQAVLDVLRDAAVGAGDINECGAIDAAIALLEWERE